MISETTQCGLAFTHSTRHPHCLCFARCLDTSACPCLCSLGLQKRAGTGTPFPPYNGGCWPVEADPWRPPCCFIPHSLGLVDSCPAPSPLLRPPALSLSKLPLCLGPWCIITRPTYVNSNSKFIREAAKQALLFDIDRQPVLVDYSLRWFPFVSLFFYLKQEKFKSHNVYQTGNKQVFTSYV